MGDEIKFNKNVQTTGSCFLVVSKSFKFFILALCIVSFNSLKEKTDYLIYHLNKVIKKLPEFIQNIVERLFNYSGLDLKYFKQQYDPEVKNKFKGFNLFNKKDIEKATKNINDEMNEYAEEFYNDKKDIEKDDGLSL